MLPARAVDVTERADVRHGRAAYTRRRTHARPAAALLQRAASTRAMRGYRGAHGAYAPGADDSAHVEGHPKPQRAG